MHDRQTVILLNGFSFTEERACHVCWYVPFALHGPEPHDPWLRLHMPKLLSVIGTRFAENTDNNQLGGQEPKRDMETHAKLHFSNIMNCLFHFVGGCLVRDQQRFKKMSEPARTTITVFCSPLEAP